MTATVLRELVGQHHLFQPQRIRMISRSPVGDLPQF
jgi:hypothetical protein